MGWGLCARGPPTMTTIGVQRWEAAGAAGRTGAPRHGQERAWASERKGRHAAGPWGPSSFHMHSTRVHKRAARRGGQAALGMRVPQTGKLPWLLMQRSTKEKCMPAKPERPPVMMASSRSACLRSSSTKKVCRDRRERRNAVCRHPDLSTVRTRAQAKMRAAALPPPPPAPAAGQARQAGAAQAREQACSLDEGSLPTNSSLFSKKCSKPSPAPRGLGPPGRSSRSGCGQTCFCA